MSNNIFAVCDKDENYGVRMVNYLLSRKNIPYTMHLFTELSDFQRFLENGTVKIALLGESMARKIKIKKTEGIEVFVLSEKGEHFNPSYKYIDRYQSRDAIVSQIFSQIEGVIDWDESRSSEKAKLIGVYSPVRRCLQTTFAITLGQLLAKEHKVLYMNFECYSGFSSLLRREYPSDLMDFLYFYNCAREKITTRLPSIIQKVNGLDFIPPGQSLLDMQGISGKQWMEILELLDNITDYEYIILDLSDSMNGLFDLLNMCYRIYTITKEDNFAMAKMIQYEQILRQNQYEGITDRTLKFRFPHFEGLPSDLNLLTHGELVSYVKSIIEEDLYGRKAG